MSYRRSLILLSLAVLIILAAGLYRFHYIPDDTYITLRYARNVIRGEGFVWNPGERVEGYTNFLWLLILVVAGKLGASLPAAARTLGFLFSLATLALAAFAARPADRGAEGRGFGPALRTVLPALILASAPPFLTWSLSGTEMPLFTFLLIAGYLLVEGNERPGAALVLFALAGLVRPEGVLLLAIAFGTLLARHPRHRAVFLWGIAIAAFYYAPYAVWKWRYFRALLPNTFYAKTGPVGLMLANGARYLAGFLVAHGYLLFAGIVLTASAGRERRIPALPILFAGASWITILALGGDWMPHYRLLLPTLPLAALVVSRGLAAAVKAPHLPLAGALLVFLSLLPGVAGYERFLAERVTVTAFERLGVRFAEMLPPGTTIGCGSTGAIGYYSDLPVLDILGLTDRWIAHHGAVVGTQPGHFKTDGAYVVEREPDLLLLGNVQIHRGRRGRELMPIKVQEREILKQPSFEDRYGFVNIPLGGGFYLSCFKRKDYFLPVEDPAE